MMHLRIIGKLRHLGRKDDGAALVEFGLILPVMLLVFAMSIESARTFWSYQATIAGVRDAARYIGRSVQNDICWTGGDMSPYEDAATQIVRNASDGTALFPSSISVASVTLSVNCFSGGFRLEETPVAKVQAQLNISYPFQSLFDLIGVELLPVTTVVQDQQRVFGA